MTNLIQTLISGLSLGSIYALIALGYTMVYGIAKMLNFAHGDVIMVGAYSGIVAVAQLGLSPWVTVIVSIAVCAVLGVVIEFCACSLPPSASATFCRTRRCCSSAPSRWPIPPW